MGAKKYAYVNSEMLVWARSETPFTTSEDVASRISGFKSELIDKWESGEELPSITEAKKLANLYIKYLLLHSIYQIHQRRELGLTQTEELIMIVFIEKQAIHCGPRLIE